MPDPSEIRLAFQGRNSSVLHVGVATDEKNEGKFTLALSLTNSRRDDMHIFVQLPQDLVLTAGPTPSANSAYKISPEKTFKGSTRKRNTPAFDEEGDVLFAKIPKVIVGEADNTNDAVFKWDFQVKGQRSTTLDQTITAWLVTKGDETHERETINAKNPPTFSLFQVAPVVSSLALANNSKSPNVVKSSTTYWVRELTDTKLTGTVSTGTQFLAVQFSIDNGTNWSAWRNTTVTDTTFTLNSPLSNLTLPENTAHAVKIKFSQTPDPTKYTQGESSQSTINVTHHTQKPTISAILTNGVADKLRLTPTVQSTGPDLDSVEYFTDGSGWAKFAYNNTKPAQAFNVPLPLEPGDFSKGIKLKATDKTGLVSEQPWAAIDSALVGAVTAGDNISYGQLGLGAAFWVWVVPKNPAIKLPPAQVNLTWATELAHGAEIQTPPNPTKLSLSITEHLTLNAPSKIWTGIPAPTVELTGTLGVYTPNHISAPLNSPFYYIPEKPEFTLDNIGGAFNSDHVVLSGRFNQVPSKPEDLVFEYSNDDKAYTALPSAQVKVTDSYFTLHLPESIFKNKTHYQPSIRARYRHNNIDGLTSIQKVSAAITVDDNLPAVIRGSVTFDAIKATFKASGTIRQTAQTSNHITHYAMAWAGEEEGKIPADKWVPVASADARNPTISYDVTAQRGDIHGILQPKLLMKTVSGTVIDQHLYSQYAYGMIDVTPTVSGLPVDSSAPSHSVVFNVAGNKVSGDDFKFELVLPIKLQVGLNRVNVSAVLNDYSENAKLLLQDNKHLIAPANIDSVNKGLIENWGDESDTQLLSLSAQAKNTSYSITFPLKIKKSTPSGDYKLTVSFKDVLRSAFSDVTPVSIVFRVA